MPSPANSPAQRDAIEQVFRRVNREVWLVTAADGARRGGLVATWAMQASIDLDDPLVMVGLAPNHFTRELVEASGGLGLHLVGREQLDLVWRFGLTSGRTTDKFAGRGYQTGLSGAPLLADCLAWLDCRVVDSYEAGDRVFYLAEVLAGKTIAAGQPLTEADLVGAATPEQMAELAAGRRHDLTIQRPMRAAWRARLAAKAKDRPDVSPKSQISP